MRGKWILSAASLAALTFMGGLSNAALAQTRNAADPSDNSSTTGRVTLGQTITGELSPAGDKDWYRLSVRTGQLYHISLSATQHGDGALDTLVRVVDANGHELARNDDDQRHPPRQGEGAEGGDSADAPANLNSYLEYTPAQNGTVFVEARGFSDDAIGGYTLNVTATPLPPDPASASVNTHARINVGQTLSAALDYAGDKDWYRAELIGGHSYRIELNSGQGEKGVSDTLLNVYDAHGVKIATDDDDGDGLNSYLEFTPTETGVYYLEARGFTDDATGTYTLALKDGDIPADTTTDASLSADGDSRSGVLSPAGDRDWYRVHLNQGQSMRVELNGGEAEGMLNDPFLTLYGPDGKEISHDDDSGEGLNSWLEFIAPAAGDYYLEAKGFGEDATGKYTITLLAGEIPGVADGAEPLNVGAEGRTSVIAPAGDKDWFSIDLVEGRPYRFNVKTGDTNGLADPVLTIFDQNGNQVAQDDDGGTGNNAYLNFVSTKGGTYYAQVSSFDEHGTGSYTINVMDTDVPGNINTDETLAADDGDDRTSAIETPGDLDDYSVQLTGGQRYVIDVNGVGDNPLRDPFLRVLNSEGEEITSDDDSGPGNDSHLVFTPQSTGTFFLQASGAGGTTGAYKISIARQNQHENTRPGRH
jgi:hypothetical protein